MNIGGGAEFKSKFLILVERIDFVPVHEGWDSWVLALLQLLDLVSENISDNLGWGLGRRKGQNNLGIGSGIASHHALASSSFLPHKALINNLQDYHNPRGRKIGKGYEGRVEVEALNKCSVFETLP